MIQPRHTIASYFFDWASHSAASGNSNDPGTSYTSISRAVTRAFFNARWAPVKSRPVMSLLKSARTMANRKRLAFDRFALRRCDFVEVDEVAELVALGLQIRSVELIAIHDQRDASSHLQPVSLKSHDLARIVRDDLHLSNAEIVEDLRTDAIVALVDGQAKPFVGFSRVGALVLQFVRAELVGEPDTAAFLVQVQENASPGFRDDLQRGVALGGAVAAAAPQHVTGQTFGVHAHEHILAVPEVPHDHRDMACPVYERLVAIACELSVARRQPELRDALDELLVAHAIGDEILDRDDLEIVLCPETLERGPAHHRAVIGEDLADDARGIEAGESCQIDRGFRLARAHEHATVASSQRKGVARTDEIARFGVRVEQCGDRRGSIEGRNARGRAKTRFDGDRERRLQAGGVLADHHGDVELVEALADYRHADQPAAELGHEIDGVRRDHL